MEPVEYYVQWREDFDDQDGWFSKSQVQDLIKRIKDLNEEGEAEIRTIIKGQQMNQDDFGG